MNCPWEINGQSGGGCQDLDGWTITVSNNFITLYELDPWSTDDLVQSLYFPDLSITLSCDRYSCTAAPSPWVGPTGYNDPVWPPLVEAEIAAALGNSWLDESQCYDPENECPPCDLICPPCTL